MRGGEMRFRVQRFRNRRIGELAPQFAYTPRPRRLEQLERLREFAPGIQPDKSYPYDYVCYQITRFRLDGAAHEVFEGESLRADLMTLLHGLSDTLDLPVSWAGEPVLSLEEVRRTYDVSLKTLRRWRAQGLVAMRFVFPDGRKRTGICQSDLETFVEAHPEIIGRTGAYSYVDAETRRAIITRAFELSLADDASAAEAAGRLAREFSCSHTTVRRLLREYDESHPEAPIFAPATDPLSEAERRQILSLYRHGCEPGELARSFYLGRTTVKRVVRDLVAERILAREWVFVDCPAFHEPGADEAILGGLSPDDVSERSIDGPLDVEREERLFRQYNYLKMLLAEAHEELTPSELVPERLEGLVRLHEMAVAVRNCLVVANLRLVVHLASRHLGGGRRLDDLVSDGTVSLMQAIERFDVSRGVRFSTYASWAIRKNFAKSIPREFHHRRNEMTGNQEMIDETGDSRVTTHPERDLREVLRSTVASLLLELGPREREVIVARFGLGREEETLEQIGQRFQVSRERVRQIQAQALRKLATLVEPELIEDLAAPRE